VTHRIFKAKNSSGIRAVSYLSEMFGSEDSELPIGFLVRLACIGHHERGTRERPRRHTDRT
jgi:hypothetical protein